MSTSLMPMDPALSPRQVTRLLPIRANLLPDEIISRRNARRMRTIVIAGLVLAVAALTGWSADAYHDHSVAQHDLATVDARIAEVNETMNDAKHSQITRAITDNKTISDELKTLMARDLRWSTLLNRLRSTGTASHVEISRITASLGGLTPSPGGAAATGAAGTAAVATLTLEGAAKDKKTIAGFIQNLAKLSGVSNPYLTSAAQSSDKHGGYSFTINADVTSAALCGRFTAPCPTGGN